MGDIISLERKRRESGEKEESEARQRKVTFARLILQEARGILKCEKCHAALTSSESAFAPPESLRVPYTFCPDCGREYVAYIRHLQGKGDPDAYWRNHVWLRLWQKWIDYRGTLDQYATSREFKQLLGELKPPELEK